MLSKGKALGIGAAFAAFIAGSIALAWFARQPDARGIPAGSGWYCYVLPSGSACSRSSAECVEAVGRATLAPAGYAPANLCRPQPTAWCYTWRHDDRRYRPDSLCFPAEDTCTAFRAASVPRDSHAETLTSVCGEID